MQASPLFKPSDQPVGLPSFFCSFVSCGMIWEYIEVKAVSATDACLKAAHRFVRSTHILPGRPVKIVAGTWVAAREVTFCPVDGSVNDTEWQVVERIVTPTGRTGGAA